VIGQVLVTPCSQLRLRHRERFQDWIWLMGPGDVSWPLGSMPLLDSGACGMLGTVPELPGFHPCHISRGTEPCPGRCPCDSPACSSCHRCLCSALTSPETVSGTGRQAAVSLHRHTPQETPTVCHACGSVNRFVAACSTVFLNRTSRYGNLGAGLVPSS
jgi:hypothetical protein